ncbi:MAG: hypothetical protein OEQ47_05970 [Acidimicrobiia bacterium]|jgi:hypothetical protein|nr:hypothetical protein [Acidimicrobiia bacterium]
MADDGKRSLFSGGRSGPKPKGEGKDALYSHEGQGPVKIDCARCGETSDVGILDALGRILRFSLWIPGREYNHRLVCPSCDKRSWTRIRLM